LNRGVATAALYSLDPTQPGYTAAHAFEALHRNMQEVYAAEPRIDPWATRREAAIRDYTQRDVLDADPRSRMEFDCRASSCRIRIYSDDVRLVDTMGDFPFSCMARYGTADLLQVQDGVKYADFYILFGDDTQESDAFLANRDATCPRYRTEWLEFVRKPPNW
jgi:hypothetical protein